MENPYGFTTARLHPRTRGGHAVQSRNQTNKEPPSQVKGALYYQYIFFYLFGVKIKHSESSADKAPVRDANGHCPSIYRVIYTTKVLGKSMSKSRHSLSSAEPSYRRGRGGYCPSIYRVIYATKVLGKSVSKLRHSESSAAERSVRRVRTDLKNKEGALPTVGVLYTLTWAAGIIPHSRRSVKQIGRDKGYYTSFFRIL